MAYAFTREADTPSVGRTTLTWQADLVTAKALNIISNAMKNYQRKNAPFAIRDGEGAFIDPELLSTENIEQMVEAAWPYILQQEANDYERHQNIEVARQTPLSDHDLSV